MPQISQRKTPRTGVPRLMSGLLLAAAATAVASSAHAAVPPVVVEFSEAGLSSGTNLSGSNAFAAQGLHFNGTTTYVTDPLFLGAGADTSGITTGNTNLMGVLFDAGATSVTFKGLSLNTEFVATAFAPGGGVLDTFSTPVTPGTNLFTHTFSGLGTIGRVEFHDNAQFIGVGRIEFEPVPEPTCLAGAGVMALLVSRRRTRRGPRI
jgi:hypothetical protein